MDQNSIYKKVEAHVSSLYEQENRTDLVFHNLQHTTNVVERTQEISGHYDLSENDMLIVYTAAWFHDTGYLFAPPEDHEIKSVELMREFMQDYIGEDSILDEIESCILATRPPIAPKSLLQEILCDADTYHLGTKDFKLTNKLVRKEREILGEEIDRDEWNVRAIKFLKSHKFHTSYCRELLEDKKQKNLLKLEEKLITMKEKKKEDVGPAIKQNSGLMAKGIQTMLRLTSDNHLELSGMADGKANILISVNSIIISVILTVLLRRLEVDTYLIIPTILFLLFSVVTIVIAILATRPKVSEGRFNQQDVITKKTNLLFFGNFYKATLEEYERAMRVMMSDTDYLYGSLIKDIYFLGVVLGRKYRLIRLAYNIFMVGIIVSVIAFTVAVMYNNAQGGTGANTSASPF
jgi:predicted metal-dependent HD superfamily phosphohydrolase